MRILVINTLDRGGGAEKVAGDLHYGYIARGYDSRFLVGKKYTTSGSVVEVDTHAHGAPWSSLCRFVEGMVARLPRFHGQSRARDYLRRLSVPRRFIDHWQGIEDFNYSYSDYLLTQPGWRPDIIHAHNLHGDYFSLSSLSILSKSVPVVWTLHDTWAITGHCAYFIDCERWRAGCGNCPDLMRLPAVRQDRTADNWKVKARIYNESHLALGVPSRWLRGQVAASMLKSSECRVIPNGVDTRTFAPRDRRTVRAELGLADRAFIVTYVSNLGATSNPYKDFQTVAKAVEVLLQRSRSSELLFVCIGSRSGPSIDSRVSYAGYIVDPDRLAMYYSASDVVVHAANAENLPCVIAEAMACDVPVVATAVGGVCELVEHGRSGFLVDRGDAVSMAERVTELWENEGLRLQFGTAAGVRARREFALEDQIDTYLRWFDELLLARSGT
jgi:glycosyltransferase involved in cell wall biosynthesis